MKKILIGGLLAVAAVSGAWAQSQVTLYGSVDAGIAYESNTGGHSRWAFNQANMQPDRWGLLGSEDLGSGLTSVFRLENGFVTGTGSLISSSTMWNRQAYVGLSSGQLGTLTLGHQSSFQFDVLGPLSTAYLASSFNAFHPGNIDGLANTSFSSIDNAIKFRSASYGGLTLNALLALGNTTDFSHGQTKSFAANYKNGPINAAAVYSVQHNRSFAVSATGLTSLQGMAAASYVADKAETFGAGMAYRLGQVLVHGLFTHVKLQSNGQSAIYQSYDAGANYQLTAANTLAGGMATTTLAGHRWTQFEIGDIHAFSKATQFYVNALYEHGNPSTKAAFAVAGVSGNQNQVMFVTGIHHLF